MASQTDDVDTKADTKTSTNAEYVETKSSRLRREANAKKAEKDTTRSSTTATTLRASSKQQGVKNATVRDSDFEQNQLKPRGIEILRKWDPTLNASTGPYAHFASKEPPDLGESCAFYKQVVMDSLEGTVDRTVDDSIFRRMDAGFVQSVHLGYASLAMLGLPEPEVKIFAFQKLFIGPHALILKNTERQLCAIRTVEWSIKADPIKEWYAPPILSRSLPPKPFGFDIYPDTQFWLCDTVLNSRYRPLARQVVWVNDMGTFCPYLSIEFKAKLDDTRTVQNQVAAAGSISLYNRYLLKRHANVHPTEEQWKSVRHYGLTIEKANWTVWHIEPKLTDDIWCGCKVQRLADGTCLKEADTLMLISWINEIHRWGLCQYALDCEDDIKRFLSKDSNFRVSTRGVSD